MAGVKLAAGDEVIHFGTIRANDPAAVVVTIAGHQRRPAGNGTWNGEGDGFRGIPGQGPGHGGVRATGS
jgi:DNA gyrase subunit A